LLLLLALAVPLTWSRIYALLAFSVLITHVLSAAAEAHGLRQGVRAMLSLPRYVAWKIALVPKTLKASGRDAVWTATARDRGLAYDGRSNGIAKERAASTL
jgi:hypothetical protein